MKDDKISRRAFIRNTSLTAAGAIVGALSSRSRGLSESTESAIRKTLSYNPDMEYRRLGKTGLWISAGSHYIFRRRWLQAG